MASDRIQNFAQIETALNTISGRIQRLGMVYKEITGRTPTDDMLIDELIAAAAVLTAAATALKSVAYDPTPPPEDPEAP
ncbi:MAG: hypothetical protein CMJ28_06730 [Phycisphaerae bacterium]|nr:hypothetical protein [Phycisphaerae bacterium]|tara:strand:- start:8064 stop:8300 length:237 start_codon:yes stop_codon:yes gene_type:complete